MWCVDRRDGAGVSLSFHATARQVLDALTQLKRVGAVDVRIIGPQGDETSEHLIAALAAEESEPGSDASSR